MPGPQGQALEALGVDLVGGDPYRVSQRLGGDDVGVAVGGEQAAEGGDADLHLGAGRGGRLVAVDGLHEAADGDDPVDIEQEDGEHDLLPDSPEIQPAIGLRRFESSQNPEFHLHLLA